MTCNECGVPMEPTSKSTVVCPQCGTRAPNLTPTVEEE